jgi:hypothetical protein
MKHLSNRKIFFLFGLVFSMSTVLISCDKHKDDFENRENYIGSWRVVEHEVANPSAVIKQRSINEAYTANITRDPKLADQVSIYNFFNMGDYFKIPAYVDGNKIIVPAVELEDYDFRGSGTLSDDLETIEWTYWVDMGYGDVKYSATYSRK